MQRLRLSIKWMIFSWCFLLAASILVINYFFTERVAERTSAHANELQGAFHRYQSFQRALSEGMAAAVQVWARSPELRAVLTKGDDEAAKPVLAQVQGSLAQTMHPDFVALVDRHGDVTTSGASPIDAAALRGSRLYGDLRSGMAVANTLLEHHQRTYLVAGEPVMREGEVVGAVVLAERLERVLTEFKQQSDDDPQKQIDLGLVHNQTTTAASVGADEWDDVARATRTEAREIISEAGEKVSVLRLRDGIHDFFSAQVNGYDGPAQGFLGSLFLFRNRVEKEARMQAVVRDNLVLVAIALGAAALFSWAISTVVTRPIREFIIATGDLAHGTGDLGRRIAVSGKAAEMVELGDNLNLLFDKLHGLASEVQAASLQVGTSSAEISAASKQMLSGAKDQAGRIESSTAAVTELSSSIQTVAENAGQATRAAQQAGERVQLGIDGMTRIRATFDETAQKIHELGASSKRIGSIVEVIRQISEQTSLLALNASIEAAHAGEQGRGFAVVADEVSSLARRVGQSAKDIEALIGTITDQTAQAVSSMQAGTREVEGGTSGVSSTLSSLKQIIDVVQDTARSVQEQALVSDDIARNMDAVQKIAQEVLASSEEAVVQGEQLHALALKLEELVRGFGFRGDGRAAPGSDGRGPRLALTQAGEPPALPARERRKTARG